MRFVLIPVVIGAAFAQMVPIGSALSEHVQLVYESGGARQAPWIYDSVRVVERPEFDRCVLVSRRSQTPRESCARGDTLFERRGDGTHAAVRPLGPGMRLEFRAASGNVLHYSTGEITTRGLAGGVEVVVVATTILTLGPDGTVIRRLSEDYAPALLTATRGHFEEPDGAGGWRSLQEFSLSEVRTARTPDDPSEMAEAVTAQPPDEFAGVSSERCRTPEHRQFDFWLGAWDVHNAAGETIGRNEITLEAGGCGLLERWQGAGGGSGVSVNNYDAETGLWTQRWIGDGATLWLEGGLQGNRMVLSGRTPRTTPIGPVLDRISWTPVPGGNVVQIWEISTDGGSSWQPIFEGTYVPKDPSPPSRN